MGKSKTKSKLLTPGILILHLVCLRFSSDEKLAGEAKDYKRFKKKKKRNDSVGWSKLSFALFIAI